MHTILQTALEAKEIFLVEPKLPGDTCRRTLFITKQIDDEFDEDTWLDTSMARRYARLEADFDRFVVGDKIPVGMDPKDKSDSAFMARIDPVEYGVWTIRSVAPSPAIRVFGAFCEKDIFVALITRRRRELRGWNSREWARAREDAIAVWESLFPGQKRLVGENHEEYISEKAFVV